MAKLHAYHVHDGTQLYMVAASNQKEAARLLGVSVYYLKNDGGRYDEGTDNHKLALSEPGRVWRKKIDYTNTVQPWAYADATPPDPPTPLPNVVDGMVMGEVKTWVHGSGCDFPVCTVEEWHGMSAEEREKALLESAYASGMVEIYYQHGKD